MLEVVLGFVEMAEGVGGFLGAAELFEEVGKDIGFGAGNGRFHGTDFTILTMTVALPNSLALSTASSMAPLNASSSNSLPGVHIQCSRVLVSYMTMTGSFIVVALSKADRRCRPRGRGRQGRGRGSRCGRSLP